MMADEKRERDTSKPWCVHHDGDLVCWNHAGYFIQAKQLADRDWKDENRLIMIDHLLHKKWVRENFDSFIAAFIEAILINRLEGRILPPVSDEMLLAEVTRARELVAWFESGREGTRPSNYM